MKNLILFSLTILFTSIFASCSTVQSTNTDYKVINRVVDSLVNQARYDSIGLTKQVVNASLSQDIILNSGFKLFENGNMTNKCSDNNIQDVQYATFNIEKFRSRNDTLSVNNITNTRVIYEFTLQRETNILMLKELSKDNSTVNVEGMKLMLWKNERRHPIHTISTPIYSDNKNIAIIFVNSLGNGIKSWTLKKNNNKWSVICVEQITVE